MFFLSSSVFLLPVHIHHLHFSPLGGLRARLHSSSSVPNFLKFQFLAPVQENDSADPKSRYTYTQNHHAYQVGPSAEWIPLFVYQVYGFMYEPYILFLFYMEIAYDSTCSHLHLFVLFRDVAALCTPRAGCVAGESPMRSHRHSWRQQIFLRVATPQKDTGGRYKQCFIEFLFFPVA